MKHKYAIVACVLAAAILTAVFFFGGNAAKKEEPKPLETAQTQAQTVKDMYLTVGTEAGLPQPIDPQDVTIGEAAYTCTISINCATILDNMDRCDSLKSEHVPADGWILKPVDVTFYEGESVFHVLRRVCKQNEIHFEFMHTPIYNSAYIEGIGNLYEFDVGELSGWMYQVNGWFPNYGSSHYALKDGDEIRLVYTCDLGEDVGGKDAAESK